VTCQNAPEGKRISERRAALVTVEELRCRPDDGSRYELVRGVLRRMNPPGAQHGPIGIVDPDARTVTIHRPGRSPLVLRESETLFADDLLPGFRYSVAALFARRR
jgi:Uma2 family endonuclease